MAIARLTARCLTCGQPIILRIGLAPVRTMRTTFACPNCTVALRVDVDVSGDQPRFSSEDVELVELSAADEERATGTVVYTDIPVPLELIGDTGYVSPFLTMTGLWGDRAEEYAARSHQLQELRDRLFPAIRRVASVYARGDLLGLRGALEHFPGINELPELREMHPVYQLGRAVDMLHMPFVDIRSRTAAGNELLTWMVQANDSHPAEYRAVLESFASELQFGEHRRKVVETAMSVAEHADALLPGLAWEHITVDPVPDPANFRIMRGDFDELRARYVEIFELSSQTLGHVGAIVNVAQRGAPNLWSDGTTANVRTMLRRRAIDREFILDELPLAKEFYDAIRRHSRNAFGHYSIEYDAAAGELVDRDGTRTSFVLFMVDYLEAARITAYLLTVAEKLTLAIDDVDGFHAQLERAAAWLDQQLRAATTEEH
jgi:hypothetical protein